ncbi:MAG: hypothetical protein IJX72_02500 [Clostridia bacterium]|nr:hypothetical protein [Clostridia bacterium]
MSTHKQAMSDYLPERLPASLRRERVSVTDFGGLSRGMVTDAVNISPRHVPALATRMPRGLFVSSFGSGTPHGMAFFDGYLFFARGTRLYRTEDGTSVVDLGAVSDTDKQFFVFGDSLYMYHDKLYVEKGGVMPTYVELDTGVIEQVDFAGSKITLPEGMGWTALGFRVGDGLRVVNADDVDPAPEGYYRIDEIHGREATVVGSFPSTCTCDALFRRTVPALERVCVSGDRVYGVIGQDVYISAAGSALDFYSKGASDGTNPVTLHTDTNGDFTACAAWQGYVVFFKSDRICKLIGSRSDSFTLHDTPAVGIPARLADTLCEVNGALLYCADGGVYRYCGQEPERIAPAGASAATDGCGGTDGYAYYLAVEQGTAGWRQYLYLPDTGDWYAEDDLHPTGMVRRDGFLCIQDSDGYIWLTSSDGRATGCSFVERHVRGEVEASVTLAPDYGFQPEGCRLTGIFIRATAQTGATLEVLADYADGQAGKDAIGTEEVSLASFEGKMTDRLLRIPVAPRLCDGVKLRFAMTGAWVIHAVIREYERAGQ